MAAPIIHGPAFSTYVRTARLALEEKPAAYELVDVPLMQGAHKQEPFLKRNPFGKVPAFEHDGFTSTRRAPSSATSTGSSPALRCSPVNRGASPEWTR